MLETPAPKGPERGATLPAPVPRASSLRRLLRAANDELARRAGGAKTIALVCECDDHLCSAAVEVPLRLYRAVRAQPAFHVVQPGHDRPVGERVVRREREFLVVEARSD